MSGSILQLRVIYYKVYFDTIRRFNVELSPYIPEPSHTPDSFTITCTTHIVEKLHTQKRIKTQSDFLCRKLTDFPV